MTINMFQLHPDNYLMVQDIAIKNNLKEDDVVNNIISGFFLNDVLGDLSVVALKNPVTTTEKPITCLKPKRVHKNNYSGRCFKRAANTFDKLSSYEYQLQFPEDDNC